MATAIMIWRLNGRVPAIRIGREVDGNSELTMTGNTITSHVARQSPS
jgi:hypothetical protein